MRSDQLRAGALSKSCSVESWPGRRNVTRLADDDVVDDERTISSSDGERRPDKCAEDIEPLGDERRAVQLAARCDADGDMVRGRTYGTKAGSGMDTTEKRASNGLVSTNLELSTADSANTAEN